MSSLFQETIRPVVQKQLKTREAILKQGNDGGSRFARVNLGPELGGEVTLPPGAFYTYTTSRQCIIRMCSGVDLLNNTDIPEGGPFEANGALEGEKLAIRYILEGGIPTKNIDFGGLKTAKEKGKVIQGPRNGFPGAKTYGNNFGARSYGLNYGDPYIRSDAKEDMGIVPMPGIIDAQIRTQTTYGSLRTAKVNFKCHNRRQLEVLELLYMRIGYPILLEWGWSTFIADDGTGTLKIGNEFPLIHEFFDKKSTQEEINEKILENKFKTGCNYDGFLGVCKNFEIVSRPDGGFDCTTEIMAMGEVLEGLKGRNGGKYITTDDKTEPVTHLEYYLYILKEYAEAYSYITSNGKNATTVRKGTKKGETGEVKSVTSKPIKDVFTSNPALYDSLVEIAGIKGNTSNLYELTSENQKAIEEGDKQEIKTTKVKTGTGKGAKTKNVTTYKYTNKELDKYLDSQEQLEAIMDKFILYKGERLSLEGDEGELDGTQSAYNYIRWDFFCDILNRFVINKIKDNPDPEKSESVIEITYYENPLGKSPKDKQYATYSTFKLKKTENKVLSNPNNPDGPSLDLEKLMDMSVDPSVCILPHQLSDYSKLDTNINSGEADIRSIGKIFFNIEYLFTLYKKLEGKDFSLFTYIKTIWDDVNDACAGTHDFEILTELERPNVIKISDLIVQNDTFKPEDLYEFKIQSNESIVRDFNINSTVPSALAATAAITAQAKSIDSLDNVSFAAINKNIRNRFSANVDLSKTDTEITRMRDLYTKDTADLAQTLEDLYNYKIKMLRGKFLLPDEEGKTNPLEVNVAKHYLKDTEKLVRSILSRYDKDIIEEGAQRPAKPIYYRGERKPNYNPPSKSAIIPLQFSALMDGISGMVIGQVFKVDKTRLPKGYQGDDVAFILFSESQTITAGQDWTTAFSGYLVSLDLEKEIDEQSLVLVPGGYDNQPNEQDLPEAVVTKTTEGQLDAVNIEEEESGTPSNEEVDTDAAFKGSEELKSLVDEYKKVAYYMSYSKSVYGQAFVQNIDAGNQNYYYTKEIQEKYFDEKELYKKLDRQAIEAVENGEVASYEDYLTPLDVNGLFGGDKPQFSLERQDDLLNKAGIYWLDQGFATLRRAREALDRINAVEKEILIGGKFVNLREEALKQYRSSDFPTTLKISNQSVEITSPEIYTNDDIQSEYDTFTTQYDVFDPL
tara:strand:+ start:21 stop:3581 length:3561 start_codon:yes stop_codon:yes gene_type:complete